MDGFAVIAEDTFGASRQAPATLQCVETVHTGSVPTKRIDRGECTEIATGAPMPDGADAVVMVEETDRALGGPRSSCSRRSIPSSTSGRRGADITSGQVLLESGDRLTPSRLGSIAALGLAEIKVFGRPQDCHPLDPATRSLTLVSHSDPDRSTTSTGSRSVR